MLHEFNSLTRVQRNIDDWYICHSVYENNFMHFDLLNHMSLYSLIYILDQVMKWRGKFRQTKMCRDTDNKQLTQKEQRLCTDFSYETQCSFYNTSILQIYCQKQCAKKTCTVCDIRLI